MSQFLEKLQETLNSNQYEAATHISGPLLIIAGAGSGKTRIITNRILFLIKVKEVHPNSIVALTFTNKAAHEMKLRVLQEYTGIHKPFIGTFHAYCFLLLKKYQKNTITILDGDDQEKMIKKMLAIHGIEKQFTPKKITQAISQIKNNPFEKDEFFRINPIIHSIYQWYEQEKKQNHALDFDDILIETLALFKQADFRTFFHHNVHHILIDEYQDTNHVQHALLKAMALDTESQKLAIESVCAVGDQDQSIYSWRGATPHNMDLFRHDFKDTKLINVTQNYRSIKEVLDTANMLIAHNTQRHVKELWSNKQKKYSVIRVTCHSEYQEADFIGYTVKKLRALHPTNSIGILYRTHTQSRTVEESLIKQNIPYTIIGGLEFYQRAEIKDIIAYSKIINNPYDRISFFRILNTPSRGIGPKFQEYIEQVWNEYPDAHCFEIIAHCLQSNQLNKAKHETLLQFLMLFKDITSSSDAVTSINTIIQRTNFISYIKEQCDPEDAENRIAYITELTNALHHFKEQGIVTIAQFLDEIALMQAHDTHGETPTVMLMTLHSAKGLEFDSVIIVGIEEQLLPSHRSSSDPLLLEEERRLLYVGITRARDRLILTHAKSRFLYGTVQKQSESRFFNDIRNSPHYAYDISYWPLYTIFQLIEHWAHNTLFHGKTDKDRSTQTFTQQTMTSRPLEMRTISKPTSSATTQQFKLQDTVKHETYGPGKIIGIEKKEQGLYLTIAFNRYGVKKIASTFINKL